MVVAVPSTAASISRSSSNGPPQHLPCGLLVYDGCLLTVFETGKEVMWASNRSIL